MPTIRIGEGAARPHIHAARAASMDPAEIGAVGRTRHRRRRFAVTLPHRPGEMISSGLIFLRGAGQGAA